MNRDIVAVAMVSAAIIFVGSIVVHLVALSGLMDAISDAVVDYVMRYVADVDG